MSASVIVEGEQSETRIPSGCEVMDSHTPPPSLEEHRAVAAKKSGIRSPHRLRKYRSRAGQEDANDLPNVLLRV
jgi:hypothetical protein